MLAFPTMARLPRCWGLLTRQLHGSRPRRSEPVPEVVEDLLFRRRTSPVGSMASETMSLKWRKELEEVTPEHRQLIQTLRQCAEHMDWQQAMEIWSQVPENAGEDWHFVSRNVLNCLTKSMRVHEAKEVFHAMAKRDTVAYNQMLLMLARLRRFHEFDALLSNMDQEAVPRSYVTYCNIMTKCKENRDWQEALRCLDEMKSASFDEAPNWSFVYLAAMTACAKARQADEAEKLMRELQAMDAKLLLPNHWNSWIISCSPDGERAHRVIQEMQDAGYTPQPPDWRALMVCHRDCAEQQKIYERMKKEHPREKPEEAWAILLRSAVLNGNPEAVEWLRQDMQQYGLSFDSEELLRVPPLKRALKMLQDWQQAEQLRGSSLNIGGTTATSEPAAPAAAADLPSGWQTTTDPATGHPYYWRSEDPAGTVTWERPK